MENKLKQLLEFIELTHQFQQIKRAILVKGEDRHENDQEHSYQLAITAWYLAQLEKPSLDTNLIVKYALIHDLVEAYAGDTYIYNQKDLATKHKREAAAVKKLAKNFPQFPQLHQLIEVYETRADAESKFVYALDKLLPIVNIYLDNGRNWHRYKVTLEMIQSHKTSKVAVSPTVNQYFQELLKILKLRQSELFPEK